MTRRLPRVDVGHSLLSLSQKSGENAAALTSTGTPAVRFPDGSGASAAVWLRRVERLFRFNLSIASAV